MKQFIQKHKRSITGTSALLLVGLAALSFQDTPLLQAQKQLMIPQEQADTLPPEKKMTMQEFDNLTANIDVELKRVTEELKKIDMGAIARQVEQSLKGVDLSSVMQTVASSLKAIDFDKLGKDITLSLKDVDCGKINVEIAQAMKEAKAEISKVNMEEVKKEMAEAGKELEKARLELKAIDMDKIMQEANEGIGKAKNELTQLRTMFTEMEKDGLINTKAGFTVEFKNKVLFINGIKQSQQITDKYQSYFKDDHFKISIDKADK